MKSGSNLEKVLTEGKFAVTGELGPPRGASVEAVREKAKHLKGMVDAVNITDNQTAVVRMSSVAASTLIIHEGLEPNFQMVCRDRNRIAMQSDILGAVGFVLAQWGVDALIAAVPEARLATMPFLRGLKLDFRLLAFTATP